MTTQFINLPELFDADRVTWPMIVAGTAVILLTVAVATALIWVARRTGRGIAAAIEAGRLTTRRVLITVAVVAALGVAGIGGARSFSAVSDKFDSPLVPLVADGMIVACTALRLAALTRGWRIPGALITTYVFIGGTVWLNIDTAHGIADALAHALAPLAYAVLVEMLAHLLRLHLRLAQPAKPRLSALTWLTSPVITTRVWLHLSRTGSDDPAAARALVQQVVRMASRLATLCPSHKLWPFDAARAARTACLQTIRDGLLSAGALAILLPSTGRLSPGELLALVDFAALGLTAPGERGKTAPAGDTGTDQAADGQIGAPAWLVAYLRTPKPDRPVHQRSPRPAPHHPHRCTHDPRPTAAAPVHGSDRTKSRTDPAAGHTSDDRTDDELLAVVRPHGPMSQRAIRRVTGVGTQRAKRLAELAGWAEPTTGSDDTKPPDPQVRGQLQLVTAPGENTTGTSTEDNTEAVTETDESSSSDELETSSSR